MDALRLESLLRQLIAEDRHPLLGDTEWVGRAVARLTGGKDSWITDRVLRPVATEAMAAATGL
ncbi:hypothetical protein RVN83_14570 [Streptomyces sp. PU10]|uniref:hypothetical protein n=1 Tax=Streptomyces TaxID=1883 RepID=UPI0027DB0A24|nr:MULTISPECIES: hypothetical protein [Streptomyces]MDU0254401.1 hypothetical protein [Streptomyces sp. PU10]